MPPEGQGSRQRFWCRCLDCCDRFAGWPAHEVQVYASRSVRTHLASCKCPEYPIGSKHWPPFIRLPTTLSFYPLESQGGACPANEPPEDVFGALDEEEEEEEEEEHDAQSTHWSQPGSHAGDVYMQLGEPQRQDEQEYFLQQHHQHQEGHQQQQQQQQEAMEQAQGQQHQQQEMQQDMEQEIELEQQHLPREDLGGMSILQYLHSKQPGQDGSKRVPCVRPESYQLYRNLSTEQRRELSNHLMGVIFDEYIASNWAQQSVTRLLQRSKGPYGAHEQWFKDSLPDSFKQLLAALQVLGHDVASGTCNYDCCVCGFLYRCEATDASQCCRCGRDRRETRTFKYRPISEWIRALCKKPRTFALLKDGMRHHWEHKEAAGTQNIMEDIIDGPTFKRIANHHAGLPPTPEAPGQGSHPRPGGGGHAASAGSHDAPQRLPSTAPKAPGQGSHPGAGGAADAASTGSDAAVERPPSTAPAAPAQGSVPGAEGGVAAAAGPHANQRPHRTNAGFHPRYQDMEEKGITKNLKLPNQAAGSSKKTNSCGKGGTHSSQSMTDIELGVGNRLTTTKK
ncbi:hypothetical protein DUNSADRAFT_958 [Dunaliella salina]|uniref:Uncharacterized protein n=1 Tax=Dunaliella salina TaxID=3046 RepID=A0ABQ7GXQ0_DUNSA|nr:hypothetical protein DUNSADRAFT_958 [Dunaliella salina]|eukprot:KAF5839387.1 hypothetical protein DUNSADRAFT_958 [Dunaliella salina]